MQRNSQFNQTLGTGALSGAALGALVGGLAGHGKGALIGSLSGAALGTGAGYAVAHRTENQQLQEDQLNKQIAAAHQIALNASNDAQQASLQVAQLQRQLANLNKQIASKKITVRQYKQQLSHFNNQKAQLNNKINYYSKQSEMHQYAQIAHDNRFEQEAQSTDAAVSRLKYAENILVNGMNNQPAG